ncbi:MAG: T9SS type A sorting domain-containing protein, partial [Bacteroidia bacterium]|nr:T9SS type A sorting domain-containing protein [Bacteroidia bacterium]
LNITNKLGDTDNDGDIDSLFSYGSRSFSIWNATTGQLVYDSSDDMEQITASNSFSVLFNASNSNNTRKDRSDDKGPEPEGVALGTIGNSTYAFIAAERIGGVFVYDVTVPASPVFVTYVNNRSLPSGGPDKGAEGIIFIPQSQSPNGQHLVIAANEVSSTLSIWGIAGCTSPLASSLSVSGSTSSACSASPITLSVATNPTVTYIWSVNGNTISGASSNTYAASTSGSYSVAIIGGSNCATGSLSQSLTINPSPTLSISGSTTMCSGSSVTQTLTGANTYSWNTGSTGSVVSLNPVATTVYTITGVSSASCTTNITRTISVTSMPQLTITPSATNICAGQFVSYLASGASTYSWSNFNTTPTLVITPFITTVYTLTGNNSGCMAQSIFTVNVNPLPVLSISGSSVLCYGSTISQTVTGASSYSWNTGSTASVVVLSPTITTPYTVTGISPNGCSGSVSKNIVVAALPIITVSPSSTLICAGETVTLSANGAITYTWNTGATGVSVVVNPTATTTYTLMGKDNNNCEGTGTYQQIISACTGLNGIAAGNKTFNLFPNPANSEVTIELENSEPVTIQFINSIGEIVFLHKNYTSGQKIKLDVFAKGVYFVTVSDNHHQIIKKLIIE